MMDRNDVELFTNESVHGGSSTDLTNGLGVGNCLARIGLTKAFFNFRQEAEPFDSILKRGGIRKPLHNLKDFLLDRFSGHRITSFQLGISHDINSYPPTSFRRNGSSQADRILRPEKYRR